MVNVFNFSLQRAAQDTDCSMFNQTDCGVYLGASLSSVYGAIGINLCGHLV